MAKKDWDALQIEYIKAYAKTGVSIMDWCKKKGLNFATAKRYIKKPETVFENCESANKTTKSEVIENKEDLDKNCEINCEIAKQTAKSANVANETAKQTAKVLEGRPIIHGGYARFFKDKSAFDVVVDFGLKDEIDLMRQRAISSIENLEKFTDDLKRCSTAEDKEVTYKLIIAAQNALDRAVARIESLSRTNKDIGLVLETIELRKAQTKETLLKADKLAQELGARAASKHKVEYAIDFMGDDNED
ncbi:MAG: terminase [Haemophilus pittmaniae]|uniref:terminase n=1 Tax=Haemophilus pittmaniae TaxID=249188 RepID=UPI0023F33C75|nr:terminase [Haemophilus pittmaniae]MBS6026362.1 terminase [Haemophilus pittmaniae]